MDYPEKDIVVTIPKGGDRLKLIELSQKNVQYFREDLKRQKMLYLEQSNEAQHKVLHQLQQQLGLQELPVHIECFDNSNFQGSYPVSAMVCFRNGLSSKKDYRHFNVKTVVGPDDFATMEEAVLRRYRRVLDEDTGLPQLIIIDGGKGQLSSAMKSLKLLGIDKQVTVIGIAKRLEELYYPGDQYPLYLDKRSETLKVIQQLRDEAHRFGITFHRKKRDKGTLVTELELIEGIGKTTAEKLLKYFKSVKKVREATEVELQEVVNLKQAKAILGYFNG